MLGMMMAILAISAIIATLSGTAYASKFPLINNGGSGVSFNGHSCTGNCIGGSGGIASSSNGGDGQNGGIACGNGATNPICTKSGP